MNRVIKIKNIAKINANSIGQKDTFQEIIYLDTGSITRNVISDTQKLNVLTDKIPSRAKRKVKAKTIIYSTVRPNQEHYGFLENPADNFIVSTGFTTIDVIDDKTDAKYIFYLLTQKYITDYLHTIGENSVSSYPAINPDDLANLTFNVPSLKTQQAIASVLSALDQKIAINHQINAQLEQMAKTLYDYWFVQFDFPNENGKPYQSSGGEMVYNDTLKRHIPKGWEVKSLGENIFLERGVTYSKDSICDNNENATAILRATNISGNVIDLNDLVFISKTVNEQQKLKPFDILIVMSSGSEEHIGKNAVYYFDKNNAFGAFCSKITAKTYFFEFISIFLQSDMFKNYVKNQCLGTNINNLNNSHILNCKIINPLDDLIKLFHFSTKPIYEKIACNTKQNHQLTQLRDFLLPMLMNGQVGVKI